MPDCIFCKIIEGKIPSKKVYEDDRVFVFEDLNPQAPTHVLIIPKKHIVGLKEAEAEDAEILGYMHLVAAKLGRERNIESGSRTPTAWLDHASAACRPSVRGTAPLKIPLNTP